MIIGKQNQTAIGTLVERRTGYAMLLHLPDGYKPEQVRDALAEKIKTLPTSLRLSLTWDQGSEMRDWKQVSVDADIDIYFCDPHSPWQRGVPRRVGRRGNGQPPQSVRDVDGGDRDDRGVVGGIWSHRRGRRCGRRER